jgi:hypothetical protein
LRHAKSHEGDRWTAAGPPEQWTIPTTLRGMIGARIDRLPAPAKTLLQHAAVIGRFFGYRALRALSDEAADLDRPLAHLLRAELIREFASPPERQYLFKHALTEEAAEASLLAEQRRDLHGRVARHLESTLGAGAAEPAALLAHHWYHAAEWDRPSTTRSPPPHERASSTIVPQRAGTTGGPSNSSIGSRGPRFGSGSMRT